MKFLFIGAHPDDVEIACGGTICRLLRENHSVRIVVLTHAKDFRHDEMMDALTALGMNKDCIKMFDEPDGHIIADARLVSIIESEIADYSPDIVITHFCMDTHQDHRNVSLAVKSACRKNIPICFFDSYSSEMFSPNVFVKISCEDEQKKEEAIEKHKSQLDGTESDIFNSSLAKAIYYGSKCGTSYAEAFCIGKVIF